MHYSERMVTADPRDLVADFYGRKSTVDDGQSIAGQESEYRDDCATQRFREGRIFADPDRSASRYARKAREDYAALLEHIRSGNCQVLSLWEASRGSRDLAEWVGLLDLCRKHNILIRIISHNRTYDVRVRRDWRTLADEGVEAADESEKISERVRRGTRLAAREGRPPGRLPYGFARTYDERGQLIAQIPHPEQAPIVREIITRVADGDPHGAIARDLNERGIPTPQRLCDDDCDRIHQHFRSGKWTGVQVRNVAKRKANAGLRVHLRQVIREATWDALVEPDVWRRAEARLDTSGRIHNDSRMKHWLTGAIRCGGCNAGVLGWIIRDGGFPAYQCRACRANSASAPGLESTIRAAFTGRLEAPDIAAALESAAQGDELTAARAARDQLREHMQGFYRQAAKVNGLSPDALATIEAEVLPQIDAASATVRRLESSAEMIQAIDPAMASDLDSLPPRQRRTLLMAFTDLVLDPASRPSGPRFDRWRLASSRWRGDPLTWGERWTRRG